MNDLERETTLLIDPATPGHTCYAVIVRDAAGAIVGWLCAECGQLRGPGGRAMKP